MAVPIVLLQDFQNGQGAGASNYFNYAIDHDSNYATIQTGHNSLVTEFNAGAGANAAIVLDLIGINDPLTPLTVTNNGVIGAHSYNATGGGTTTLTVAAGQAIVAGLRTVIGATTNLSTAGLGTDTLFLNLDQAGQLTLQTSAGAVANSLDIFTFDTITDVIQGPTIARLARVFPDGDDFAEALERQAAIGTGPTNPLWGVMTAPTSSADTDRAYDKITDRIEDLERRFAGITLQANGQIAPDADAGMGISGTQANPFLRPATAAGVLDTGGFFRVAADTLAWAGQADSIDFQLTADRAEFKAGLLTDLGWAFVLDSNTGVFSPAGDTYALVTGGVEAARWNPQQQRSSATQGRVKAASTGDSIGNGGTLTAIPFAAADEVYDQGAYHSDTNNTRFIVPTGHDGLFSIIGQVDFNDSAEVDTNPRRIVLRINGTTIIAEQQRDHQNGEATIYQIAMQIELVATDYVELMIAHNAAGNLSVDSIFAMFHAD